MTHYWFWADTCFRDTLNTNTLVIFIHHSYYYLYWYRGLSYELGVQTDYCSIYF